MDKMRNGQHEALTFWGHLDELRRVLFRMMVAVITLMLIAFFFKDELFAIVLAPKESDFIIYRLFCEMANWISMPSLCPETFSVKLINLVISQNFTS